MSACVCVCLQAPAIVALLAGNPSLSSVDEAAVRVQQDNTPAVQAGLAGAKLLERVVLVSPTVTHQHTHIDAYTRIRRLCDQPHASTLCLNQVT